MIALSRVSWTSEEEDGDEEAKFALNFDVGVWLLEGSFSAAQFPSEILVW